MKREFLRTLKLAILWEGCGTNLAQEKNDVVKTLTGP